MEPHSFHSFCVKYYDKNAYTDSKMKIMLNNNIKCAKIDYDIIIIDEAQDMT